MIRSWLFRSLCISALASSALAAIADIDSVPRDSSDQVVPGAYIVELSGGSLPSKRSLHEDLYSELDRRGVSWNLRKSYSSDIFNGASVQVSSTSDLVSLASVSTVVAIYPVYLKWGPKWTTSPCPDPSNLPPNTMSSQVISGIDKLQAQGYTGKGIKVAVIDSGVDYNLPALGGGFGPNKKVYTGYDFVGDAFTGTNTPQPDSDPYDNCYGHGTGVAAIIAGNPDSTYNFTGAAPDAKIAAYRVFSCSGASTDEIVVQAIIKAYQDGNDIINLSLTDRSGWSESVLSVVADRVARKGKIVTAAGGNLQGYGTWFAAAPGTGNNVIDVASVDAPKFTLQTIDVIGTNYPNIPYLSETAFNITGQRPIWVPSSDVYACSTITSGLPSHGLSQYIVVVSRGNCAFTTKIGNLKAVGAVNLLVYNNGPGYEAVDLTGINGALISQADGQYLVSQANNSNLLLSFPLGQPVTVDNVLTGGLISDFSSWGPTNEMNFKPNVAAAGGYILTPWPTALGTWAINSGTSFSSPLVAGAGALYMQAKGKGIISSLVAGLAFKTQIEQTATALTTDLNDSGSVTSLALQGAGLMNAYNAVNYKTFITPSLLELNDTANAYLKQTITIINPTLSFQTYTITHISALTVLTFSGGLPSMAPTTTSAAAGVKFSSTKITVWPLIPATFTVTFTPPTGLDPSTFPVYSGQIQISNGKETVVASYQGLAANLKDMPIIDTTNFYFGGTLKMPFVLGGNGVVQGINSTRTFSFTGTDYPLFYYRLVVGSPSVHLDLVDANITFTGTRNKRDLIDVSDAPLTPEWGLLPRSDSSEIPALPLRHRRASAHSMKMHHVRHANLSDRAAEEPRGLAFQFLSPMWDWLTPKKKPTGTSSGTFQQVPIIGSLQQLLYAPRSTPDTVANGGYNVLSMKSRTFANGTTIPNGSYRVLLRALKITGDPSNENDYESWLGPVMNFAAST